MGRGKIFAARDLKLANAREVRKQRRRLAKGIIKEQSGQSMPETA